MHDPLYDSVSDADAIEISKIINNYGVSKPYEAEYMVKNRLDDTIYVEVKPTTEKPWIHPINVLNQGFKLDLAVKIIDYLRNRKPLNIEEETRHICPKCDYSITAKWSGVKCSNPDCDYWFCF